MAWFDPSPSEISAIEQIETAYYDEALNEDRRLKLLQRFWIGLEKAHGSKVLMLVSPEGVTIHRPFTAND